MRESPGTNTRRLGQFAAGARVQVKDGPVLADGYRWWLAQDSTGLEGWVAEGSQNEVWLSPQIGEPRPVSRPIRLNDVVVVTASPSLALRFQPGRDGVLARRAEAGEQLRVTDGPIEADGWRWWQVTDSQGAILWAAEGDGNERWLTPLE